MLKKTVSEVGGRPVILMDSITKADEGDAGAIVISASHGGASSGEFALEYPLGCVFFNDAGIGKDQAGIVAVDMLEKRSVAAGTVSHFTCCIGDAADMWENGVISHVNETAHKAGMQIGQPLKDAVNSMKLGES